MSDVSSVVCGVSSVSEVWPSTGVCCEVVTSECQAARAPEAGDHRGRRGENQQEVGDTGGASTQS